MTTLSDVAFTNCCIQFDPLLSSDQTFIDWSGPFGSLKFVHLTVTALEAHTNSHVYSGGTINVIVQNNVFALPGSDVGPFPLSGDPLLMVSGVNVLFSGAPGPPAGQLTGIVLNGDPLLVDRYCHLGGPGSEAIDAAVVLDVDEDRDGQARPLGAAPDLESDEIGPLPSLPPLFRRGDCDSSGVVDFTDGINSLSYTLFGSFDPTCLDACDADDTGVVDISDGINTLTFVILGAFNIPTPGPFLCSTDLTADGTSGDLGCVDTSSCEN